jgi:imidazole glycerol phosphate synthase glutamine amidotransferase subunit
MTKTVAICRYGAGNVRSVELAFRRLGAELVDDVETADLAVLPGVGSAHTAMHGLRERGLDALLRARTKPTLGICLGLQLALEHTEEDGGVEGLAIVPGKAVRVRAERVPRIGWAHVEPVAGSAVGQAAGARPTNRLAFGESGGEAYWFAHSYVAESPATTATSEGLAAIVEHGSFTGVQFHPEKSGPAGARFLERCLSRA